MVCLSCSMGAECPAEGRISYSLENYGIHVLYSLHITKPLLHMYLVKINA